MPTTKRTANYFPSHINPDKPPANVGYDPRSKSWRYYRKGQGRANRGKQLRFRSSKRTLSEIWQFAEGKESKGGILYQFKDICAKHASDLETDVDATVSLRHSGRSITHRHYRRRPSKIMSLR